VSYAHPPAETATAWDKSVIVPLFDAETRQTHAGRQTPQFIGRDSSPLECVRWAEIERQGGDHQSRRAKCDSARSWVCCMEHAHDHQQVLEQAKTGDGVANNCNATNARVKTRRKEEFLPSPTPPKSKPMGWSNWVSFHSSRCKGTCGSSGPQPSTREMSSSVPICHFIIVNEDVE